MQNGRNSVLSKLSAHINNIALHHSVFALPFAYMGLFLKSPGQFPSVTEALKKIPEVVECHYTTGQYDLFIKIYAKNNQHLLNIIHNKLQPLGLARTESLISFKEAFKRQIPIDLDDE